MHRRTRAHGRGVPGWPGIVPCCKGTPAIGEETMRIRVVVEIRWGKRRIRIEAQIRL
jgi:hypothetical protein